MVFWFCKMKGYYYWKCKFHRPCVRNPSSRWLQISRKLEKQWRHNFLTWRHRQAFFNVYVFCVSALVTAPSFMSISWLFLELWEFSFIKDWPEIWESKIPLPEFCPISRDWSKSRILNLARMSLIKSYWKLQSHGILLLFLNGKTKRDGE